VSKQGSGGVGNCRRPSPQTVSAGATLGAGATRCTATVHSGSGSRGVPPRTGPPGSSCDVWGSVADLLYTGTSRPGGGCPHEDPGGQVAPMRRSGQVGALRVVRAHRCRPRTGLHAGGHIRGDRGAPPSARESPPMESRAHRRPQPDRGWAASAATDRRPRRSISRRFGCAILLMPRSIGFFEPHSKEGRDVAPTSYRGAAR